MRVFAKWKPTLVYHSAAYTAADAAEDEGKELDYAINVTGTENVARRLKNTVQPFGLYLNRLRFDGKNQWDKNGK